MPFGYPFYLLPGVYVRTQKRVATVTVPSNLRLPMIFGEGAETVAVINHTMIRASSNSVDNRAVNENVSARFLDSNDLLIEVNGTSRKFKVKNLPIVTGDGSGTPTKDPVHVTVTVNGDPAGVVKVDGANGIVYLSQLPIAGDVVKVSYYYDKRDVKFLAEDLSFQADGTRTTFKVKNPRIVDGSNGGVTATLTTQITVTVDGLPATVTAIDGLLGKFTLATAPSLGSQVLVTYYSNTFEDTSDPFPDEENVVAINQVGNNPNRLDYVNTVDYALANGEIHWGSASTIGIGETTPGGEVFDSSKVITTMVDNYRFMEQAAGTSNGVNKTFTISAIPMDGSGRSKPTSNPDLIEAYVGSSVQSAVLAGPVLVTELYEDTRQVVLNTAPSAGQNVYVSYYYNLLSDASYEVINKVAGANPVGKYEVVSTEYGPLALVEEGTHSVADANFVISGITYPDALSDLQVFPGVAVNETITVTFTSTTDYTVTSTNVLGSSGSGSIEQTYVDARTGFRFTALDPNLHGVAVPYNFAPGDTLEFVVTVGGQYTVSPVPNLQIPGLWLVLEDTIGIAADDSIIITTFNKSGKEPTVGDLYFVSYEFEKENFGPFIITNEQDNEILIGPVNGENRLSLAVRMALRNGALAVAARQIPREFGQPLGSVESYIQAIDEQKTRLPGDVNQYFLVPLRYDPDLVGFLKQHVEQQSSEFFGNRRLGVFGFSLNTSTNHIIDTIKSLKSDRMWAVYPDGVIVSYQDALGREIEIPVDGSFLAAALVGRLVSPTIDSATPLLTIQLVDVKRLFRRVDTITRDKIMSAGVIYFKDVGTAVEIIDAYTTDPANILTAEPNVNMIDDEIADALQQSLKQFRGRKSLAGLDGEIAEAIAGVMNSKASPARQIVAAYNNISVAINPLDPREGEASVNYAPVFPFKWLRVTLNVQTSI